MSEYSRLLKIFFLLWLLDFRNAIASNYDETKDSNIIQLNTVQSWAVKLGTELWHFGDFITRRKEVQESFKQAQIEPRDGKKLVQNMADDIHGMMELKISAVKRIVDAAENMALSKQNEPVPPDYQYYNSKDMEEPLTGDQSTVAPFIPPDEEPPAHLPSLDAHLEPNPHFSNIPVNTNFSSVHVPTNVYDWSTPVIKGIRWSENLDSIFTSNYHSDPTLSWQFFGSSTGFMRHYPALKWKADPVDIYDCRTRAWYMEAAASPKDVVVLVDRSGSMTGQRRDIARHVVTNILDTLGNNDFVNVMTFAETVEEVVPCFEDSLVQATLGNIRELKLGLENFNTMEIANFSAALTRAFDLLETYRNVKGGAYCNQAIMLVTDGVPYNYKEIFEAYNWPYMPVRVFTYLIGREVADVREVKWMACANRGYYVHLSTLAEVRERVLEHVNVLARPLVLQREVHPVVWTPVYANVTDPKVADYLWEQREREEQKERFMSQRRDKTLFNSREEQDRRFVLKQKQLKQGQYSELGSMPHQLMTSVSMPVYDRRDYENITENVLINEAYWVTVTKEVRIANLLGVAGTDVPLTEIQAMMTPHKVGVGGYAFVVTNNGYILIHPDLRPVFQQILKPSYNSVDMIEVELEDNNNPPRVFSPELLAFRTDVIEQRTGSKSFAVKYHSDDMKRVARLKRHYFYKGIAGSPFTLVVTIPEQYGLYRLIPPPSSDIHRLSLTSKGVSTRQYFRQPENWSVHPEWLYCRHYERTFGSAEEELLYFLERIDKPGWRWPLKPKPPEHLHGNSSARPDAKTDRDHYYCDHSLMQALVFDARVTDWFNTNISSSTKDDKGKEFIKRFGITTAFLSTHSGLTRWQTFPTPEADLDRREFGSLYPRAIDEIWYRRAVEQGSVDKDSHSFVYSVDFNAGIEKMDQMSEVLVTAAHAIFHTDNDKRAPAAVVGFQFHHERLKALFTNITSSCGESGNCARPCHSEDVDCFIVDNNGWVVVSEFENGTGQFFGEVRPNIMKQLVEEGVFKAIHVVDYQAVCFREKKVASPAGQLLTPLDNLRQMVTWVIVTAIWIWNSLYMALVQGYGMTYSNDYVIYQNYEGESDPFEDVDGEMGPGGEFPSRAKERDFDKLVLINRTRPTPCDREMHLYELESGSEVEESFQKPAHHCKRPFIIQPVPTTNLLLVVVEGVCPQNELPIRVEPVEVEYNASLPCVRHYKPLYRRRPKSCIRQHHNESSIDMCGRAWSLSPHKFVWLASLMATLVQCLI